jgi:glycosyltransferase involved in cell wall biosynthesis
MTDSSPVEDLESGGAAVGGEPVEQAVEATPVPAPKEPVRTPDLDVELESPLPARLAVGRGTSLFVYGSCFHRSRRVTDVQLLLDGVPTRPLAELMPRTDLFEALVAEKHSDPQAKLGSTAIGNAYRSAFWGFIDIPPRERPGQAEVGISVGLADGGREQAILGMIELEPDLAPLPEAPHLPDASPQHVAICMATYEPPLDLFERQVESIKAQTHRRWTCVISDDASNPELFEAMRRVVGDDPRFVLSRSPRRLGFYHNFERALRLAPPAAPFLCFCDQDDRWYPDKLEVLLRNIGSANLVYSDMRITDSEGKRISSTYWSHRRNAYSNLASVLIANTITGAASMFRRELLEFALPFPPRHGDAYHDHWVGLVALTLGKVRYVDRPLYEYVQHGRAAIGHARANADLGGGSLRDTVSRALSDPPSLFAGTRDIYFWDYCRLLLSARILRIRCGEQAPQRKRHALDLMLATQRSRAAVGWLALRRLRRFVGATETLDSEGSLLRGLAWRSVIGALSRGRDRPRTWTKADASLPPSPVELAGPRTEGLPWLSLARAKTQPLEVQVRGDAPARINILIPQIDLKHLFGGYIAKLNLAGALARRGHRVRLVAVDRSDRMPQNWRQRVESFSGLEGIFDRVEVAFGRDPGESLEMNPRDQLLASTWWTAYQANELLGSLERDRFVYVIQEYEPFTFPMGSMAALAEESYRFPHFALFSSELLRDFFRRRRIGVYAAGPEAGDRDSVAFENAITAVAPPTAAELARRESRRLLFYSRPESHAARNMFELGYMALAEALSQGTFDGWQLCGVGSVDGQRYVSVGSDATLEVLPRLSQDTYAELLPTFDVGLALMYTPHPSLVPIEMASAGLRVVTNSFENKTPEAMSRISANLIVAEPSITGVAAALKEAVATAGDSELRARGAAVNWPRDWDSALNDEVIDRLVSFIENC